MAKLTEEELVIFTEKAVVVEEVMTLQGPAIKIVAHIEAIPRQQGDKPLPGTIGTLPPIHPQLAAKPIEEDDNGNEEDQAN